jgi:STE24 endopeptidase
MMSPLALAIVAAIVLSGALGLYLLTRQAASVAANRERVPEDFASAVSSGEHKRAAAYTLARTRLELVQTAFDTGVAVIWLAVLLGPLYDLLARGMLPGLSLSVAIVVVFAVIERVLHLPFSIFSTFGIEAEFGFNRAAPGMFVMDQIKSAALALFFGVPALYCLFFLLRVLPDVWWLIGWAGFMGFAIAMTLIYPSFIAPMFNKFTPMPQGQLKTRIEALLAKCGFESNGLFVMNASKRSTHGNAYFTGFGKAKRIVFFDTLLQNHTPEEILSILAHELGHYKLGHITQRIAEMAVFSFVGFALLYWAFSGGLAGAFGLPADPGLVVIVLLTALGPIFHLASPLTSFLSRRAEYQADGFAKAMTGAESMISALTKLSRDNLSTLTPDELYALFYYSHPPVPLRIARLKVS